MRAVQNTMHSLDQLSAKGVCLTAHPLEGATVVIVTGELDACNIDLLTDFTRSCLASCRSLILDLSHLDFLGAQGIRSLHMIAQDCERKEVHWAVVPSRPVSRLLRICDEHGQVPSVSSIDEALEHFSGLASTARGLLQLVSKPS